MALLKLKDIGKIYVSEGNVVVGIRGINLAFERGEFVAITGESGSGKSTLLNVISGMDTYEEGELYINNEATSHYIQPDWEEYRKENISFIFQNYNIIDSFTVLENVELALMNIDDIKERRQKALELIDKVGMSSHIHHKGSKLSGGQKQRTIIARALAKDSPIILADEPTGNLDSKTSKEIIQLLKEVSKDKLLIIVTHNFDEVEQYATRHIRIFDGSIEFDHQIREYEKVDNTTKDIYITSRKKDITNGFILGKALFFSKPKLSIFLCMLMILGFLAIFLVTSAISPTDNANKKGEYMFTPMEGRIILTKRGEDIISDDELNTLNDKYNAKRVIRYDYILDDQSVRGTVEPEYVYNGNYYIHTIDKDYGNNIIGRYPKEANEVLLYLPINDSLEFGRKEIELDKIYFNQCEFDVVGIKYFYNNKLEREILLTEEGLRIVNALNYFNMSQQDIFIKYNYNGNDINEEIYGMGFSFDIEPNKIYIDNSKYFHGEDIPESSILSVYANYSRYNYYGNNAVSYIFENNYTYESLTNISNGAEVYGNSSLIMHPLVLVDLVENSLKDKYPQASIILDSNRDIDKVIDELNNSGYVAIRSDEVYLYDDYEAIILVIGSMLTVVVWIFSIVFLAFFINLCSAKSLNTFKEDIAIMRSMGIPTTSIKIGMYVRMIICLVPAFILMILSATIIFRSAILNPLFSYLEIWQYFVIFIGMIFLTYRITKKQIKKLFSESVKTSLKGGNN